MELLSIRRAAQELRISPRTLSLAVRRGDIPGYKLGDRTVRVNRSDLDRWVRGKAVRPWNRDPR